MQNQNAKSIFKTGSKTFFYSSLFFPEPVKSDVSTLYSFVRVVDNFVDTIPQKKSDFTHFRAAYTKAQKNGKWQDPIISNFLELSERKQFDSRWITAFFDAMASDLQTTRCKTLSDTQQYMYGSAEVVGLMMAAVLDLPKKSYTSAQLLGRAFQYINFIRDVSEDLDLGRIYLPEDEYQKFGFETLEYADTKKDPKAFYAYVHDQIDRYFSWYEKAKKGFIYIPKRFRVPIQTAADMYAYTAREIHKNPYIIYTQKVKPSKIRIVSAGIKNSLFTP